MRKENITSPGQESQRVVTVAIIMFVSSEEKDFEIPEHCFPNHLIE
jgi:hypothetical protein